MKIILVSKEDDNDMLQIFAKIKLFMYYVLSDVKNTTLMTKKKKKKSKVIYKVKRGFESSSKLLLVMGGVIFIERQMEIG